MRSKPGRSSPRTGLAEAGDAGIDQSRIDGAQRRIVDLQPFGDAGAPVLDHHVGGPHQFVKHLSPRILLEIEGDAALVAVERKEAGAVVALQPVFHRFASLVARSRRLDLDHVGAHVAEQHAAIGPGHHLTEIENADTGKGQVRGRPLVFVRMRFQASSRCVVAPAGWPALRCFWRRNAAEPLTLPHASRSCMQELAFACRRPLAQRDRRKPDATGRR